MVQNQMTPNYTQQFPAAAGMEDYTAATQQAGASQAATAVQVAQAAQVAQAQAAAVAQAQAAVDSSQYKTTVSGAGGGGGGGGGEQAAGVLQQTSGAVAVAVSAATNGVQEQQTVSVSPSVRQTFFILLTCYEEFVQATMWYLLHNNQCTAALI